MSSYDTVYFYHNDHLGTPIKMTNSTGDIVWSADYLPFGEAIVDEASSIINNFRFPGQYWDEESAFAYNWHRNYAADGGRYLTPDPIGLSGGMNPYSYVANNPLKFKDFYGLTLQSNWNFFWDWALGKGTNNRFYGPNDIETIEMQNSIGVSSLRYDFKNGGCEKLTRGEFGTYEAYWYTTINPFTADWSDTSAQVGGFARATVINNGDGTVTYTIRNVAGTYSFFGHGVPNRESDTGPMRSITQTFQWTEQSTCTCKKQ